MAKKLQANLEILPGYRLVRYLGRGGFGEVWEAMAPGGLAKAVKIAPVDGGDSTLQSRELEGLQKIGAIRHPYLLSIESYQVVEGHLIIVMELADMSLADRNGECIAKGLPGIPRDELIGYMREAAEVLDLLGHRHGLQHLDIKPENLFLSGGHVKVGDFGLVQPRNAQIAASAMAISPPYAPPELFDGRVEPTADQFSLAVTFQELLTGTKPFDAKDVRGIIRLHLTGRPELGALPAADRVIVGRALHRSADARYETCSQFVAALEKAVSMGFEPVDPFVVKSSESGITVRHTRPMSQATTQVRPFCIRRNGNGEPPRKTNPAANAPRPTLTESLAPVPKPQASSRARESSPVRHSFVAHLPLEVYAHKLRGFIDAMDAEVVQCEDEKVVLRMGSRRFLGLMAGNELFVQIDTWCQNVESGFRVVDVTVWTANGRDTPDMNMRGFLLIRCLKAFLMAAGGVTTVKSEAVLRSEILN